MAIAFAVAYTLMAVWLLFNANHIGSVIGRMAARRVHARRRGGK